MSTLCNAKSLNPNSAAPKNGSAKSNTPSRRKVPSTTCRHGLAGPEPPIKGLALRFAGLGVVRASSPAPRTNGA